MVLERSVGPRFKGKAPTVSVNRLEAKWVDEADPVNIGRASVGEQLQSVAALVGVGARRWLVEAAAGLVDRITWHMPVEVPFVEKDVSPRNNSSIITLVGVDSTHAVLTADAGVPALECAWDYAHPTGFARSPTFVQIGKGPRRRPWAFCGPGLPVAEFRPRGRAAQRECDGRRDQRRRPRPPRAQHYGASTG